MGADCTPLSPADDLLTLRPKSADELKTAVRYSAHNLATGHPAGPHNLYTTCNGTISS
ncbi:MAG: hypothetical protein H6656_01490 [Ardenticatenaceae bacterium]|nr:hypothetical protein [Ardenticatenaceae bacterium]